MSFPASLDSLASVDVVAVAFAIGGLALPSELAALVVVGRCRVDDLDED
jgi:hypothetical protein